MALLRCRRLSSHDAVPRSVGSMKAAVYDTTGGPEVFRYADIDEPQLRKRDQHLIVGGCQRVCERDRKGASARA